MGACLACWCCCCIATVTQPPCLLVAGRLFHRTAVQLIVSPTAKTCALLGSQPRARRAALRFRLVPQHARPDGLLRPQHLQLSTSRAVGRPELGGCVQPRLGHKLTRDGGDQARDREATGAIPATFAGPTPQHVVRRWAEQASRRLCHTPTCTHAPLIEQLPVLRDEVPRQHAPQRVVRHAVHDAGRVLTPHLVGD